MEFLIKYQYRISIESPTIQPLIDLSSLYVTTYLPLGDKDTEDICFPLCALRGSRGLCGTISLSMLLALVPKMD